MRRMSTVDLKRGRKEGRKDDKATSPMDQKYMYNQPAYEEQAV